MKIGILQVGETPEDLRAAHGDYNDAFMRMLAGRGFEFDTYRVFNGGLPDSAHDAEGWLITGSKFGVYEAHSWIPPLEDFLRKAFKASAPIVGVCFGHQVLAQALGGKVEKFSGGWSVGAKNYEVGSQDQNATVMAWHQDQITQLPEGATVIGQSDFCQYAMLSYGDRALSIQPHPEFTTEFMKDLIKSKRDILPPEVAESAIASIGVRLTSTAIADQFETFFKQSRKPEALSRVEVTNKGDSKVHPIASSIN